MQKAAFSIIDYKFDKVELDLQRASENLNISFNTQGKYEKINKLYKLSFTTKVSNKETENEPFILVNCIGIFRFEDVNNLEDIPDFFYRNAIAILFPYVRAYISLLTTQANVKGIILPTLNLSSLEDKLKENTSLE